jgi:pre-rRNA-processing protein TSR4
VSFVHHGHNAELQNLLLNLSQNGIFKLIFGFHSMTAVLPCFYVYTQSEGSTVDGSPVDDDDSAEFEETELVDAIEDPDNIVDGVGELWEEEEYEPEHSRSTDQTYLNFKKKLDLSPEQCFRYCFGGPPLWAMEAHDEPDKCGACGGPRVYEMQLMPPLLYFLQQASKDLPPSAYGPSEWSWFTLLVYSCAQVLVCFLVTSWFFCFQNI